MTMQAMYDRLVEAGFTVDKRYDTLSKGYQFTISKDDRYTSALFEYPADTSKAYCDQKQREFIDFIINKWHDDHMCTQPPTEQTKKLIFVGMKNRDIATDFMQVCSKSLSAEGIYQCRMDYHNLILETRHTEVRYICFDGSCTPYDPSERADAIFGRNEFRNALRKYAKPDVEEPGEKRMGLVDYICQIERGAHTHTFDMWLRDRYSLTALINSKDDNTITDEDKSAFVTMVREYAKKHELQWVFYYPATMNYLKIKVFYMHRTYDPEKIIMVNWDKVSNIFDLYNTVVRELDAWRNEIEPLYITMPPRNGKSLYRHILNAVYGKSPDYTIQSQLYAALMKGENNMPTRNESNIAALAAAFRNINNVFNPKLPGIKTVHFSGPVTAVIWEDKTKTVVRCKEGEVPDYEKGFAMAIAKKALGTNKSGSNYYDIFKKYLPKPEVEEETIEVPVEEVANDG